MNLAVVGNSGVGKSLLINRLRRLRPQAEGWAAVGVNETTREPSMLGSSREGQPGCCLDVGNWGSFFEERDHFEFIHPVILVGLDHFEPGKSVFV